jgi:uncharacterized protein
MIDRAIDRFALDEESIHGPAHWARVLENGMRIAPFTGGDKIVVGLFAIFHDCCRQNDGTDIYHGPRAAKWVADMEDLGLDRHQKLDLIKALAGHTNSLHTPNVTVATCWDADRLDISRCGFQINPMFLTTDAAKNPDVIAWAQKRGEYGEVPKFANPYVFKGSTP